MKRFSFVFFIACIFIALPAFSSNFDYDKNAKLRILYGHTQSENKQSKNNFPLFGNVKGTINYKQSENFSFNLHGTLKAKISNGLENLNQGHWGEEFYVDMLSNFGDIYIGQMKNAAAQLSITDSNLSIWQSAPTDIVDFINNPNWKQNNKNKYYATLTSTVPNTDASAFKISYLTPEYNNTTIGISYTPEVKANDSPISKFSSYYGNSSYSIALYNYHDFNLFESDFYVSFSNYENSHSEYGIGFSIYTRGWSIFGSYLKTEVKHSDKHITTITKSKNKIAYYDDFRKSTAYNFGISYEFSYLTSTLSYFDSFSQNTKAYNRIINLNNSIKFDKNYSLYLGIAYIDFQNTKGCLKDNNGFSAYTGVQFEF